MKINLYRDKFISLPERPKFDAGFQTKYFAEDPLMVVFSLFFEFTSPILNPVDGIGESAERYFRQIGDDKRADKCIDFRSRLMHLMTDTPYLMKNVVGLSDIYDYTSQKIYNDREVTIETYETLDFRIAKLAELYTDMVWDFDNQRRVLPDNFEWINYHVIVNDIRELAMFVNNNSGEKSMINITPYLDSFVISFRNAKLSFAKSNVFLSNIDNENPTVNGNSFRLIGGKMSKKKNRILLTNEEKNSTITDMSAKADLKAVEKSSISLGKTIGGLAIDYAREEGAKMANKHVLAPLKNSLFGLMTQNSLTGMSEQFDLTRMLSGEQSIGDVVPNWKNSDRIINDTILNKNKVSLPNSQSVEVGDTSGITLSGNTDDIINAILNDVNRRLPYD